jgi:hypothetical protein
MGMGGCRWLCQASTRMPHLDLLHPVLGLVRGLHVEGDDLALLVLPCRDNTSSIAGVSMCENERPSFLAMGGRCWCCQAYTRMPHLDLRLRVLHRVRGLHVERGGLARQGPDEDRRDARKGCRRPRVEEARQTPPCMVKAYPPQPCAQRFHALALGLCGTHTHVSTSTFVDMIQA